MSPKTSPVAESTVYAVRLYHHIAQRPDLDSRPDLTLPNAPLDVRSLGRILRVRGLLLPGQRLRSMRVEKDGRVVAFPAASIWHSVVLTPKEDQRES